MVLFSSHIVKSHSHTPTKNSSMPLNWKVKAYPLGSLQYRHFLLSPCTPSYQALVHSLQPNRLLKHFVAMSRGFIGATWQILQMKASRRSFTTPIGKDKIWLTCIISITIDLISLISEFKSEYLLGYKLRLFGIDCKIFITIIRCLTI